MYAFSTENWKRPVDEVRFLMNFNERLLLTRRDELHEQNIKMQFIGRRDWRVPKRILRRIDETARADRRQHRDDGVDGVQLRRPRGAGRRGASDRRRGHHAGQDRPRRRSEAHLYDPDMPDPELMVRTSGEYRMSNFLMWELAYSELVFTDVLWPDFRRGDLYDGDRRVPAS